MSFHDYLFIYLDELMRGFSSRIRELENFRLTYLFIYLDELMRGFSSLIRDKKYIEIKNITRD